MIKWIQTSIKNSLSPAEAKDNPADWGGEEGDNEGDNGEKWQETPWFCEVCDVPVPPAHSTQLATKQFLE